MGKDFGDIIKWTRNKGMDSDLAALLHFSAFKKGVCSLSYVLTVPRRGCGWVSIRGPDCVWGKGGLLCV